jgi:redox-sensitive bicupin YhaK (pirin superfamily)
MTARNLQRIIPALETSDGAGVRIRRSLGQTQHARMDPFLMLDEFGSDQASDYIAGFPAHPHRGFETVTYMIDGHMLHEDHLGNRGDLRTGGVQWMTAGRGIIHSEMPQQESGLMRGFQLWLNLPAAEKMKPAGYRDIQPEEIPAITIGDSTVRLIAGELTIGDKTHTGAVSSGSTRPLYADLQLAAGSRIELPVAKELCALLYLYEGGADLRAADEQKSLPLHAASLLGEGDRVVIEAGDQPCRILLIAGQPIREPVAQYGPFVMNTREELEQALQDFREGRLTNPAA